MKKVILFLMLLVGVGAQAATNDGHVWLKLQSSNVRMDEAVNHFGEWINLPAESTFELLSDETDQIGMRHLRYRQYVAGVEVQASMLIVHGRDGLVTTANGVVMEQQEQPKTIRRAAATRGGYENCYLVKDDDGYHYARLDYDIFGNADIYVDIETGKVVKSLPRTHSVDVTMQGRSMYSGTVPLSVKELTDGKRVMIDESRNIYTLNAQQTPSITDYEMQGYKLYEDEKGNIIYDRERYIKEYCPPFSTDADFLTMAQLVQITLEKVYNLDDQFAEVYLVLKDINSIEVAKTPRMSVSSLPLQFDINTLGGTSAFLNDRGFKIEVWLYNYVGEDTIVDEVEFGSQPVGLNDWKGDKSEGHLHVIATGNPVADIHWGMQKTYDWYKDILGRNSFDDKGSPIYNIFFARTRTLSYINSFIHMHTGQNNAFANYDEMHNCYIMEYGIGDGVEMRPVVALDILAHEYTHLVTASTANLEFMGESGALNESFSDMLGISIKKAVKGSKANWLIGDEVMLQVPCMRDMSNKIVGSEGVQPIYDKGDNWYDGTEDYGGVHTNSGVPNYWFYLVANKSDYGMETASKIAYRTLTQYLTPTSNFYDARKATLQATVDIYGYDDSFFYNPEYDAVESAWNEVGVFDEEESTGINAVTRMVNNNETDNWYNLQGQRIDKPSKTGVYIHNEKKVVIK